MLRSTVFAGILVGVLGVQQTLRASVLSERRPHKNYHYPQCETKASMEPHVCDAEWIFCIDAECNSEPLIVDGVSVAECKCWKQNKALSILPTSSGGAPCVMGYKGGEAMCKRMKAGELISTFAFSANSYLPKHKPAICQPGTPFVYCWGAKCHTKEDGHVYCHCPLMSSKEPVPQQITVADTQCMTQKDPCSELHNSNPPGLAAPTNQEPCFKYSAELNYFPGQEAVVS